MDSYDGITTAYEAYLKGAEISGRFSDVLIRKFTNIPKSDIRGPKLADTDNRYFLLLPNDNWPVIHDNVYIDKILEYSYLLNLYPYIRVNELCYNQIEIQNIL